MVDRRRAAPVTPRLPMRRGTGRRLLAGAGLTLLAVVLSGAPASAHAVLLGTDPPVSGVVAVVPAAVRLHFSGPVEIPFSRVQVTEPDGRQLPAGPLRRAGSGRDLVMALPSLGPGSYTVSWQTLSTDGHIDAGRFGFSVGAPSGTPGTAGAGALAAAGGNSNPNLGFLFGQVRFAWLAVFMFLVGATVFRRRVWDPAIRAAGASVSAADTRFRRSFSRSLPAAWAVLAAGGVLSAVLESATVSGGALRASVGAAALVRLLETQYGRLWVAQMVLTLALGLPVLAETRSAGSRGLPSPRWRAAGALTAGGLAVVVAANGHAGAAAHPVAAVAVLAGHLLAAAVWAGGLGAMVVLAVPAWRALPAGTAEPAPDTGLTPGPRPVLTRQVLRRFSRLAVAATAVLVVTGVLSTRGNLGVLSNLWRVAYGRMLLAKLVLLAAALALGARHLVSLPRRLTAAEGPGAVRSFERTTRLEVLVLAGAVGVAAALVSAVPGRYAEVAAARPVVLSRQIGANHVELVVAPTGPGANQLLLSFVGDDGVLVSGVTSARVTLRRPDGAVRPVDLQTLSSGAFSASVSLPVPGAYRVGVTDGAGNSATFSFKVPRPLPG